MVHGDDLLFRSKVPATTVEMTMMPPVEMASRGTPSIWCRATTNVPASPFIFG